MGRRGGKTKVTVVGKKGKTKEIELSKMAKETLLTIAQQKDKSKLTRGKIAEKRGVTAPTIATDLKELEERLGASFYFGSKGSVISFLPIHGKTAKEVYKQRITEEKIKKGRMRKRGVGSGIPVTIIKGRRKEKTVYLSKGAYETLKVIAQAPNKMRLKQGDIVKMRGAAPKNVAHNLEELSRKLGSEFYFPRGRGVELKRSVISLLPLYGRWAKEESVELGKGRLTPIGKIRKEIEIKEKKKEMLKNSIGKLIHPELIGKGIEKQLMERIDAGEITKKTDIRLELKLAEKRAGIKRKSRRREERPPAPVFRDPTVQKIYDITKERIGKRTVIRKKVGKQEIVIRLESQEDIINYKLINYYLKLRAERGITQNQFLNKIRQLPSLKSNPKAREIKIKKLVNQLMLRKPEVDATQIRKTKEAAWLPKRRPVTKALKKEKVIDTSALQPAPGITIRDERKKVDEKKIGYGKKELFTLHKKIIRRRGIKEKFDDPIRKKIESGEITTKSQLNRAEKWRRKEEFQKSEKKKEKKKKKLIEEQKLGEERWREEQRLLKEEKKIKEREEEVRDRNRKEKEEKEKQDKEDKEEKKKQLLESKKKLLLEKKEKKVEGKELNKKQQKLFEFWMQDPTLTTNEIKKRKRAANKDIDAVIKFAAKQGIILGRIVIKKRKREYL